jgi:predicted enzyme related to lactoylglutathione lyase
MQLGNALNWFEIPVSDFERGKKFYETIFDYQMPEMQMGPVHMGFFYTISREEKLAAQFVQAKVMCLHNREVSST